MRTGRELSGSIIAILCFLDLYKLKYLYKLSIAFSLCKYVDVSLLGLTWSCSATSNRQLGHHEVSTVVSNLHHPGCCCIQESRGDQGCC